MKAGPGTTSPILPDFELESTISISGKRTKSSLVGDGLTGRQNITVNPLNRCIIRAGLTICRGKRAIAISEK